MTDIVADDERLARAQLTYLAEPGDDLLGVLVRANGAVRAVEAIRSGCLIGAQWPPPQTVPAVMTALLRATGRWRSQLELVPAPAEITRTLDAGIRLICPGDHEWPGQLDDLGYAGPHALWLRGTADLRFSCLRSAAIAGARGGDRLRLLRGSRPRRIPRGARPGRGLRRRVRRRRLRAPGRAQRRRRDGRGARLRGGRALPGA